MASAPQPAGPAAPSIALLMAATALGPFSLHIVMPLLPGLATRFRVDYPDVQLIVTAYLFGMSVAQLVLGMISDRVGRRPVMLAGIAAYVVASALCILAPTAKALVAARLLQAIGGSVGTVLGRAIIRDRFPRDRAASLIAYVTMAVALGSIASPAVGGLLDREVGAAGVFGFLALLGAVVLLWAALRLPETNDRPAQRIDPAGMLIGWLRLLRNRVFLAYCLMTTFNMCSWFAFVSVVPHVLTAGYGRAAASYGLYILPVMVGYILGNFVAGRFTTRIGGGRMLIAGTAIGSAGFAAFLAAALTGAGGPWGLFLSMTVAVLGAGFVMPQGNAGAVGADPSVAGTASGLLGFVQMTTAALVTVLVGQIDDGTPPPMAMLSTGCFAVSALALLLLPRAEWTRRVETPRA